MGKSTCSVAGCENKNYAKSVCNGHYQQLKRGVGLTPLLKSGRSISERLNEKITKTESCWIWGGVIEHTGYGVLKVGQNNKKAHRLAFEEWAFPIPAGKYIDHICHNRSCVNPDHLRLVTRKQNMEHRISANSNSSSGIQGAIWSSGKQKWEARVSHDGTRYHLGVFDSAAEAGEVARLKRLELFTHNDADRNFAKKHS